MGGIPEKKIGKVIKGYDSPINDFVYKENEVVELVELKGFDKYVIFYEHTLDWIPKDSVSLEGASDVSK